MKSEMNVSQETVSHKWYFQTMFGALNNKMNEETGEFVVKMPKYRQGECMD